jgi:hypothetical protein
MSDDASLISEKLFNVVPTGRSYQENEMLQEQLLDQYKLYVEMADRISARRQTANSFFLSLNTAIVALVGYVHLGEANATKGPFFWSVALAGLALCYLWYRIIRSYRDLNTAKFKVIHEIERKLPLSPYDAEWEAVGRGKNPDLYLPFTSIEIGIPWIFFSLHLVVLARSLIGAAVVLCLNAG